MKRFSKNLVAAVLGMGIVLAAVAEMQAGSRFGGSRSSSSRRSSGRSFGSSRSVGSRFGSSNRSSSSRRIGSSSVKRITPTRTPSRTLPTRNVVKRPTTSRPINKPTIRPTKIGSSLIRRPQGIKLSNIKRPSSPIKTGVNKSFFGGHHNNHHNTHGHRRNFWWNFGRHVYHRPYVRNYCWGYVPNNCAPTYYNFCEPTYGTVVVPVVVTVQTPAPNVIVDNSNRTVVQPNETPADVRPLDAESMVGIWTAKPAEGVVITATLKQDGTFTWDMASGDQEQSIAGKFEMKGNQLILNREDGQKLKGRIERTGEKSFNFKAKGGDEKDPGLNFAG